MCFQCLRFGLVSALIRPEGGRRAEDPFRGLRAGPARSSPRLLPPPTPKTTPNGPYPSAEAHQYRLHFFLPAFLKESSSLRHPHVCVGAPGCLAIQMGTVSALASS